jgi:hypothetical protein
MIPFTGYPPFHVNLPRAREIFLFLLAGATLTFIALIGQIYQTGAPLWQLTNPLILADSYWPDFLAISWG